MGNNMIELNIFYNTEEDSKLSSLNIDVPLSRCDIRKVTFYQINAISPFLEDGIEYCTIHSNGDSFVCTDSYIEAKNKIENNY